ncbi:MAG TPA: sigma-70 family RNA polymerase sigma factor [Polyangiales bacterium]|nr:sigma-70 family RNA polymerase sigma factor [Polyangiales bacterium]
MAEFSVPASTSNEHEAEFLASLRAGDEAAFCSLVDTYHLALVRLARQYVANPAVAEEVAQETWVAFVEGLARFEGRSSLKTWLFRTLLNCARSRKRKEVRSVPFSALSDPDSPEGPAVDPTRFRPDGVWAGHWAVIPRSFAADGESKLLTGELRERVQAAIDALPDAQREVLTLRDVEGFAADEVCEVLGVSEVHQRVLLHRARAKVRASIEAYVEREGCS